MDAPNDYKTAGIFMLVSGALSVLVGAMLLLLSFCMYCWVIIGIGTGIAELIVGMQVMQGKKMPAAMAVSIIGLIGALVSCNWIGVVMEILALVWLNKPEVKQWLAQA